MQCNKPYIMTTIVLFFYHIILAILHITGLKIGEFVRVIALYYLLVYFCEFGVRIHDYTCRSHTHYNNLTS